MIEQVQQPCQDDKDWFEKHMVRDEASFGAFLDAIRRFVRDEAIPREAEVEQSDEVPADLVQSMRQAGFFGWSIPESYGGAGLTTEDGRVTIMMPHPERSFKAWQLSWHPKEWQDDSPWMILFRNARKWLENAC